MKLDKLSPNDLYHLEFTARAWSDPVWKPILPQPDENQRLRLELSNYHISEDGEVRRVDISGRLRECGYGIPCTYICHGLAEGKCKQLPIDPTPLGDES